MGGSIGAKIAKINKYIHLPELEEQFQGLRETAWCYSSKFSYPFQTPQMAILCLVYGLLLSEFAGAFGDNPGGYWSVIYLLALIVVFLANLYVFTVAVFWSAIIIVGIIALVALIFSLIVLIAAPIVLVIATVISNPPALCCCVFLVCCVCCYCKNP